MSEELEWHYKSVLTKVPDAGGWDQVVSITGALTRYHWRQLIKNPYVVLFAVMAALSLYLRPELENLHLSGVDWIRWSLSRGMAPAYLLMPFLIRSTPLGLAGFNGEGFLIRRTEFIGIDVFCGSMALGTYLTLCIGLMVALIARANHTVFDIGDLVVNLLIGTLVTTLLIINVLLLLNFLLKNIWLTYLLIIAAWFLFFFYPELAPWHVMYRPHDVFSYGEPMIVLNRLFCLLSAIILGRIYVSIVENAVYGQGKTSDQGTDFIVAGQRTRVAYFPWQGMMRAEILIFGWGKLILAFLLTLLCVIVAKYSMKPALAGMGGVWLALMPILYPYNYSDRLLASRLIKSWLFIGSRFVWWAIFTALIWGPFFLLMPAMVPGKSLYSLLEVGGVVWLSIVFLHPFWARLLGIMLWAAIVFVPTGFNLAGQQPIWGVIGVALIMLSIFFYRRMPT